MLQHRAEQNQKRTLTSLAEQTVGIQIVNIVVIENKWYQPIDVSLTSDVM